MAPLMALIACRRFVRRGFRASGNQRLRSSLIIGAWAAVRQLMKREPRTEKERWLKQLIERRGPGRAVVALVNKNIRTAWAMLHDNTEYRVKPIQH